jgi:hypothetical protein
MLGSLVSIGCLGLSASALDLESGGSHRCLGSGEQRFFIHRANLSKGRSECV